MAINPTQISTQPIEENYDVAIEIVDQRPVVGAYYTESLTPNKLVGYYNLDRDHVELYITDTSGHRYLKLV